jgi:hypothetical protein
MEAGWATASRQAVMLRRTLQYTPPVAVSDW